MLPINREELLSLEEYSVQRSDFRHKVMTHKKKRVLRLGEHCSLYFEDRLTVHYQVQEMLRIEKIFDQTGIEEELDAYNPLIPTGNNLKATFMIEYSEPGERKIALKNMLGIEQQVWLQVGELEKIYPIANEDLERSTDEKTSSVHFMRFELTSEMIHSWKNGTQVSAGIKHPYYSCIIQALSPEITMSLAKDFS